MEQCTSLLYIIRVSKLHTTPADLHKRNSTVVEFYRTESNVEFSIWNWIGSNVVHTTKTTRLLMMVSFFRCNRFAIWLNIIQFFFLTRWRRCWWNLFFYDFALIEREKHIYTQWDLGKYWVFLPVDDDKYAKRSEVGPECAYIYAFVIGNSLLVCIKQVSMCMFVVRMYFV